MYIERMVKGDCPKVAEIEKMCFSDPWSRESLEKEFSLDYAVYFVAKSDENELIGHIGVHNVCGEGEITMVAVHPDFRRNGTGEKLVRFLLDFEKESGIGRVNLEVRESNYSAISLYEKCGFSRDGIRKNYYSLPTENAVLMSIVF